MFKKKGNGEEKYKIKKIFLLGTVVLSTLLLFPWDSYFSCHSGYYCINHHISHSKGIGLGENMIIGDTVEFLSCSRDSAKCFLWAISLNPPSNPRGSILSLSWLSGGEIEYQKVKWVPQNSNTLGFQPRPSAPTHCPALPLGVRLPTALQDTQTHLCPPLS